MGLPQYLKRKLNAMKEDEGGAYTDLQWVIYFAGKEGVRAHERTPLIDIIKSGLKLQYGYTKPDRSYSLEKEPQPLDLVSTTRFIGGWKDKDGTLKWEGEPAKVQYRYLWKYEKRRAARIEREMELVRKRDKRLAYQNKVYQSRTFPPTVAVLIWERDVYTCQICGRNVEELKKIGRWLTVDHIKEWEDGGLTTMSNGQTLCNIDNTAKHHAKKYFALTNDLRTA